MPQVTREVDWVHGRGNPFVPVKEWCAELTRQGVRCHHCGAIREDAKPGIATMFLSDIPESRCLGMVLLGALIVHREIAVAVGVERLEENSSLSC